MASLSKNCQVYMRRFDFSFCSSLYSFCSLSATAPCPPTHGKFLLLSSPLLCFMPTLNPGARNPSVAPYSVNLTVAQTALCFKIPVSFSFIKTTLFLNIKCSELKQRSGVRNLFSAVLMADSNLTYYLSRSSEYFILKSEV